jgi:hypothetical protein
VKGVPRLVILRPSDGKIICDDAHKKLAEEGPMAYEEWIEAAEQP